MGTMTVAAFIHAGLVVLKFICQDQIAETKSTAGLGASICYRPFMNLYNFKKTKCSSGLCLEISPTSRKT
jgi:hypothetical protein